MVVMGNGSLRYKHNKYYYRFRYKDYTGAVKQVERAGTSNKLETTKLMLDAMQNIELDYNINKITLSKYCLMFLDYLNKNRSANTYNARKVVLYKYVINTSFANKAISDITVVEMRQFINDFDCTDKQKIYNYNLLKYVFNRAYKEQFVNKNIFDHIDKPCRVARQDKVVIGADELKEIFNYLDGFCDYKSKVFKLYLSVLAETGCRRGEALALTYDCIDFDNSIIKINKNIVYVDSTETVGTGKTAAATRDILISQDLLQDIKQHRQNIKVLSNYIFAWEDGTRINYTYFANRFRSVQQKLNFNTIYSLHSIRHYNATLLNNANVNAKIIQQRLGHSDIQTTYNTYVHADVKNQIGAVEVLKN